MFDSPIAIICDSTGAVIASANPFPVTQPKPIDNATPVTGTITSATPSTTDRVIMTGVGGYEGFGVILSGTWVATLIFEVSSDSGTTWTQTSFCSPVGTTVIPIPAIIQSFTSNTAGNGAWRGLGTGGVNQIRIRATAYTSGTVNVTLTASVNPLQVGFNHVGMTQDVYTSTVNATVANLAAGATFTGTAESTLGVACIRVLLKTDQPCQVTVQQSKDGTNWDWAPTLLIPANTGKAIPFQAVGAYYQVLVKNIGAATTTFMRMAAYLCPVLDTLPPVLGPDGGVLTDSGLGAGNWSATPNTFFGLSRGVRASLAVAPDNSLLTYSQSLTDCGSFRDDFIAALTANLTGSMTFTNGSTSVVGVGCAFTTEIDRFTFIRATGHAEGTLASVFDVIDDNTLVLATAYSGANAAGVVGVKSSWQTVTGTGTASIAVATSVLSVASGATAGQNTYVQRGSDYAPMESTIRFSVSQRIANQTVRMGFFDNFVTPKYEACIELTGTDNTQVTLVTRSNTGANDVESTTVTLPTGINTGALLNLKLDIHNDRVILWYDPADGSEQTMLAVNKNHIPPPYTSLLNGKGILNTGGAVTTTTLSIEFSYLNDYNLLDTHIEEFEAPDNVGAALTNVSGSASSVTLLVANVNRKGATIFNDSTASLYVKFGSTASTTSFTVRLFTNDYYEVPAGYNGIITGIWASATGSARVTELS
jgi:hypothetical protein